MKLHKVIGTEKTTYFGSRAEAVSYRFKNEKKAELDSVEIPTDKKGLIEWLNENCIQAVQGS